MSTNKNEYRVTIISFFMTAAFSIDSQNAYDVNAARIQTGRRFVCGRSLRETSRRLKEKATIYIFNKVGSPFK